MTVYSMPPDGKHVLLKIVSARHEVRTLHTIVDTVVKERDVSLIGLELVHVSSQYGPRSRPYQMIIPACDTQFPYSQPKENGELGYWVKAGTAFFQSTEISQSINDLPTEEIEEVLQWVVGKNVIGQIRHRARKVLKAGGVEEEKVFDIVRSNLLPVPDSNIEIRLSDGTSVPARVGLEWIAELSRATGGVPAGTTVQAWIQGSDRPVQVCWATDRWCELLA